MHIWEEMKETGKSWLPLNKRPEKRERVGEADGTGKIVEKEESGWADDQKSDVCNVDTMTGNQQLVKKSKSFRLTSWSVHTGERQEVREREKVRERERERSNTTDCSPYPYGSPNSHRQKRSNHGIVKVSFATSQLWILCVKEEKESISVCMQVNGSSPFQRGFFLGWLACFLLVGASQTFKFLEFPKTNVINKFFNSLSDVLVALGQRLCTTPWLYRGTSPVCAAVNNKKKN